MLCRPLLPRARVVLLLSAAVSILSVEAKANSFHITGGTTTSSQTLNNGETGLVDLGATLKTSGISVTLAAGNVSLNNAGSIQSTGKRAIDTSFGSGNWNISIMNSGTITASTADAFRINNDTGTGIVSFTNSGTISETGTGSNNGQAIDFANITSTTGGTTITNMLSGIISAADADAVRPGTNATVNNYGKIFSLNGTTTSTGNDGIDFQSTGTGFVNNYGANGSITGARHGITGDLPVTIYNEGTITGQNGSGINFDTASTSTMTVTNKGTIIGTAVTGDGDGIDIDGLSTINNYGTIKTAGIVSGETNEALALGGGTINNYSGGTIESVQRAITIDDSNLGNAFGPTTIYNEGTIKGDDGEAISITSAFGNTLTNKGTISGSTVLGSGNDTINLYTGSTTGSLDGGAGSDTIHLTGTGTGTLANVANVETLKVDGGTWTLNGTQSYSSGVMVASGAQANVTGTINGDVTNNGTVSVHDANVAYNGKFINNGAYVSDPSAQRFNTLSVGQTGYVQALAGDLYQITGDLENHSTQRTAWNTAGATLEFVGDDGSSHNFQLAGADLGDNQHPVHDFNWGELEIDGGNALVLKGGDGDATNALYVDSIVGALISGHTVTNITGADGLTIYYDPTLALNAYLDGKTYLLEDGGRLVANVPEPAAIAMFLSGLTFMGFRRRRNSRKG